MQEQEGGYQNNGYQNNNGGGYQKKAWNNSYGGGNNNNGGGFQKKPFNGGGSGYSGGGGGFLSILTESKFRIPGEKDPSLVYKKDYPPSLGIKLEETNPRFIVHTNIEGIEEPIIVRADPIIFEIILDCIIEASLAEPGFRKQFITKNKNEEGRVYDETRTTIGRNKDNGVVYLKMKSLDKDSVPEVTFLFAARSFFTGIQGDGVQMTPGDFSCSYSRGWANKLKRLMDVVMGTLPKKKKPWVDNKANPQGNNPQQQQQQNNYQQRNNYQQKPYGGQPAQQPRNDYGTNPQSLSTGNVENETFDADIPY